MTLFRLAYHNLVFLPVTDAIYGTIKDFPGAEKAKYIIAYGYVDQDVGLTYEVFGWHTGDEAVSIPDDVRSFIRGNVIADLTGAQIGQVKWTPLLRERYKTKLEMLKSYDPPEIIERTRSFDFLDSARHPLYIDDVQVSFGKPGLKHELCWATVVGSDTSCLRFWATLVNEPHQDFGVHEGDKFPFYVYPFEIANDVICKAWLPEGLQSQ